MVEFAVLAPLLVLTSIGIIDFGRALWTNSTLEHSAREAARYASIHGYAASSPASDSDVKAQAVAAATGIALQASDVTVEWSPNNTAGSSITVRIEFSYDFLVSGLVPLPPLELQASATRTVF